MKLGFGALVAFLIAALVVGSGSLYTVPQTQQDIVLPFGEAVRVVSAPGLHVKVPFIDNVSHSDNRVLDLDVPGPARPDGEEMITADQKADSSEQKRLAVDAFCLLYTSLRARC